MAEKVMDDGEEEIVGKGGDEMKVPTYSWADEFYN